MMPSRLPILEATDAPAKDADPLGHLNICLTGDVMLGRGIDQILPHPGNPRLYERYVSSAETYLELAEEANGPIPRPVDLSYVWGDALAELRGEVPHLRIVNLETSITTSQEYLPKGINYRMNPANIGCLTAFGIDCCVMANNHALDWGRAGLLETLATLGKVRIASVGAGRNAEEAAAPAIFELGGKRRVLVFGFGSSSSGIPSEWAAGRDRPGVNFLADFSKRTLDGLARQVERTAKPSDLRLASIHWGANWGCEVPHEERHFAHGLIDIAGFDVIHGHSAHHAKGIEIYRGKPILYGCGDFIDDYEGVRGYEALRADLAVMYLVTYSATTRSLVELRLVPFQIRKFRLNHVSPGDLAWLQARFDRESAKFGTRVVLHGDNDLKVVWS